MKLKLNISTTPVSKLEFCNVFRFWHKHNDFGAFSFKTSSIIENNEVTKILYGLKIFDNAATVIVLTFAEARGGYINKIKLTQCTTRKAPIAGRCKILREILEDFYRNPPPNLAVTGTANYLFLVPNMMYQTRLLLVNKIKRIVH